MSNSLRMSNLEFRLFPFNRLPDGVRPFDAVTGLDTGEPVLHIIPQLFKIK